MAIFTLSVKHLTSWLLGAVCFFFVAHVTTQWLFYVYGSDSVTFLGSLLQKFDMNTEQSFTTWFSVALMLGAAGVIFTIWKLTARAKGSYMYHWLGLGVIFIYLSIDEGVSLHELATAPMQQTTGIESGPLFFAWVIPALALVGLFLLTYLKFWFSLPRKIRFYMAIACALFVGGAIGIEMFGAYQFSQTWDMSNPSYFMVTAVEESFELLGLVLFIYALLEYLKKLPGADRFFIAIAD